MSKYSRDLNISYKNEILYTVIKNSLNLINKFFYKVIEVSESSIIYFNYN